MQVLGLPDKPLTDRQLEDLANWVANTTLETPPNLWVLEVFSAYRQSLKNTLVSFFEDYLATGILVVRTKVYQSTSPLYDYV
jgi:S-methylmethionine-dependent homocysteine/selenocysteine methylase